MTKEGLARNAAAVLRHSGIKKLVSVPKQTFYVSNDEGYSGKFVFKNDDKQVMYTVDDVKVIIDAVITVMEDAIKQGEEIAIKGFGKLDVKYRKPRATKDIVTGEWIDVKGRYVPKFTAGRNLKTCVEIYEKNKDSIDARKQLPWYAIVDELEQEGGENIGD